MTSDLSYCSPDHTSSVLVSLTCTWSSSMPAVTMPSPASRYEGNTWRQISLEDSLEEMWSFSSSISSGQQPLLLLLLLLLLLGFMCGLHSCQLSVLIQTKLLVNKKSPILFVFQCQPALSCPICLLCRHPPATWWSYPSSAPPSDKTINPCRLPGFCDAKGNKRYHS